ncbi:MAG: DUF1194 domain-containing protein, partial [Candidatus Omnitrophica bacterium]|nr:DUF1194 domain-containing protein [Candidatus Omnitrophota bacterium]
MAVLALLSVPDTGGCQDIKVDLELSLVVDSSPSIDNAEFQLMMEGYASAVENPSFLQSVFSGPNQAVAINLILYTVGQSERIGWTRVSNVAEAAALAEAIRNVARRTDNSAGTGDA